MPTSANPSDPARSERDLPERFGRFEVRRVLGQGGMGTVYAAEDPLIGRRVAIKEIRLDHLVDPAERAEMVERFKLEFRAAGTLSHPNIVTIYDVGEESGAYYLAMEHVDGRSLAAVMKDAGRLETDRVLDLAGQIADGLDHAHDHGIVHRDVKPANILLTGDGRPKITDFGLVKVMTSELTTTGTVLGTPAYMSPEQVRGEEVDGCSDQFSFAVLLYAMLTGITPFRAEHPSAILYLIVHEAPEAPHDENPDLPPAVDAVILRGLSKNPEERFGSCSELVTHLRRALRGGPRRLPSPTGEIDGTLVEAAMAREAPGDATRGGAGPATSDPARPKETDDGTESDLTLGSGTVADLDITSVDPGVVADRVRAYRSTHRVPRWLLPLVLVLVVGLLSFFVGRRLMKNGAETPASGTLSAAEASEPTPEDVESAEERSDSRDGAGSGSANDGAGDETPAGEPSPSTAAAAASPTVQPLRVTSEPPGARVVFDGRELDGRTPLEVEARGGESHRVEVSLEGYETESWSFDLASLTAEQEQSGTIHFPLRSTVEPGYLLVDAAYPVRVEVAGRRAGPSRRLEVPVPPGRHRVTLVADEVFFRQTRDWEIESGQRRSIPTPHVVRVDVFASPGNCRVEIDGREIGSTPINDLRITTGLHEITYHWPSLDRTRRVREVISPQKPRLFGQPDG